MAGSVQSLTAVHPAQPADAPADVIHFEAEGNKYFLNLANQSILASAESRTKWEFRACHLPQTPDKPATLGYPPATSGHLTLTSDYATTICLHADYEREIIDYKPCNYLDDSGQQEFYFLYDKDAKTVRLAGKPNSEEQSFWKLQLGAGRPPAIAVKPRAKDDSDEGIVFAWQ